MKRVSKWTGELTIERLSEWVNWFLILFSLNSITFSLSSQHHNTVLLMCILASWHWNIVGGCFFTLSSAICYVSLFSWNTDTIQRYIRGTTNFMWHFLSLQLFMLQSKERHSVCAIHDCHCCCCCCFELHILTRARQTYTLTQTETWPNFPRIKYTQNFYCLNNVFFFPWLYVNFCNQILL